ncbi:hypothetical protein CDD83_5917 [Cordyceps sp. RAO-2017]|nr:hypothetical protein CDD83_5917 [Cordyceps sp. RAO-2017]
MAKTRAPSKHSRAARRATSPSINTDKSLKDVSLPGASSPPSSAAAAATTTTKTPTERPSVLAVHRSAGVQKKAKAGRKTRLSAKARRRHDRGLEMAEAVVERTRLKTERSVGRARTVQARRKAWDDINKETARTGAGRRPAVNVFEALARDDDDAGDEPCDGDDSEEDMAVGPGSGPAAARPKPDGVSASHDDDDDEIL